MTTRRRAVLCSALLLMAIAASVWRCAIQLSTGEHNFALTVAVIIFGSAAGWQIPPMWRTRKARS